MLARYFIASIAFIAGIYAQSRSQEEGDVKVLAGAPVNSLNLTVTPESPIEGHNVTLDWEYGDAGTAPYNVQIGTGGYYANLTWLYSYSDISETNLTWTVNVTAGETLVFQLWDATNTTTYTQNHLILPTNETSIDNFTTSELSTTESPSSSQDFPVAEAAEEDEDEDESFLGELLADIQAELDG